MAGGLTYDLSPFGTATEPRVGEDEGRGLAGALLHLRPATVAAHTRFYFPEFAVGSDVHVPTGSHSPIAVPPVSFDSHRVTV